MNINFSKVYLYTDSTVRTGMDTSHFKTIEVIRQQLTSAQSWYHVQTSNNPADIISRECKPVQLLQYSWWWNKLTCLSEATHTPLVVFYESHMVVKDPKPYVMIVQQEIDIFSRFSCLCKLIRAGYSLLSTFRPQFIKQN